MRLKELLEVFSGCVDVYENVVDEIGIALDWDYRELEITKEGKEHFKDALNYHVSHIDKNFLILDTEATISAKELEECDFEDSIPKATQNAIDFFNALAGFCSVEDYDKWFKSRLRK